MRDDDGELTAEERAAYGRVLARVAPAKDFFTDTDVLVRERDELRRELSQFDCRRTGGPVSDVGGVHCPPGAPCMRCRLESSERERRTDRALLDKRENVSAQLEERTRERDEARRLLQRLGGGDLGNIALRLERELAAERAQSNEWLTQLRDAQARLAKLDAAAAEMVERVKHLVWLTSGAPMLGEEPLT